jgi:hypothetical protein
MRFPYSVVCALFAFPEDADQDTSESGRSVSTFRRATTLLATLSGRDEYTGPGEKFENVSMLLFRPVSADRPEPAISLLNAGDGRTMSEDDYFGILRDIYNRRNPHAIVGEIDVEDAAD